MKPSPETEILRDENVEMGIILRADYTSEHEWGVESLQQSLLTNPDLDGIDRYLCSVERSHYVTYEAQPTSRPRKLRGRTVYKPFGILQIGNGYFPNSAQDQAREQSVWERHGELREMVGRWDERQAQIFAYTPEAAQKLEQLKAAATAGRLCVWVYGSSSPFGRGGLAIVDKDLVPEKLKAELLDNHLEYKRLQEASRQTGIVEQLEKAGKRYIALKPKWGSHPDKPTAHPVTYWLNPWDQQKHQFGWYTVEELQQWINDQGPVFKQNNAAA